MSRLAKYNIQFPSFFRYFTVSTATAGFDSKIVSSIIQTHATIHPTKITIEPNNTINVSIFNLLF